MNHRAWNGLPLIRYGSAEVAIVHSHFDRQRRVGARRHGHRQRLRGKARTRSRDVHRIGSGVHTGEAEKAGRVRGDLCAVNGDGGARDRIAGLRRKRVDDLAGNAAGGGRPHGIRNRVVRVDDAVAEALAPASARQGGIGGLLHLPDDRGGRGSGGGRGDESGQSGYERGGHGGSRQIAVRAAGRTDRDHIRGKRGDDVEAWRGQRDSVSEVRKIGQIVVLIGSRDAHDMISSSGIVKIAGGAVAGGGNDDYIVLPGVIDRQLHRLGISKAGKAHGNDLRAGGHGGRNRLHDGGVVSTAGRIQDLENQDLHRISKRRDAGVIGRRRRYDAGDMRAVPEIVLPGARRIRNGGGDQSLAPAPHQLASGGRVRGASAGVYEIRMGTIGASVEHSHFHSSRAGGGCG